MALLTTAQVRSLLTPPPPPCVSLYMPTHRSEPLRRQDPIRYRNLLRTAEESLRQMYPGSQVNSLMGKFDEFARDEGFWSQTLDGLAVLGSAEGIQYFRLPRTMPEVAVVADSFHVKPLLRYTQSADRYEVLSLTQTQAALCEGNRYGLEPMILPDEFPDSMGEALGTQLTPEYRGFAGGPRYPAPGGGGVVGPRSGPRGATTGGTATTNYGIGSAKDSENVDIGRYFQVVDDYIIKHVSNASELPLVLVALPENESEFRKRSQNRFLLPDGVRKAPGSLSADEMRAEVWKAVEPRYRERLDRLSNDFGTALSRQMATKVVGEAAKAIVESRVGLLMVDADKHVPGKCDPTTGNIQFDKLQNPDVDDLLDDLAELTLKNGGEVIVVPSDRMPSDTGLAAIYRF
jgi:hypothetical protein